MSAEEIDDYLAGLEEPKRSTLETLRRTILEIVPEAEQVISNRVPAFRVHGKTIAGFAAFRDHLREAAVTNPRPLCTISSASKAFELLRL